jgi:hypothetical protein
MDLSEPDFLNRITPVTRNTYHMRGLNMETGRAATFLVDDGADRLVYEWKAMMLRLVWRKSGLPIPPIDPVLDELLHRAGSATYEPKRPALVSEAEFFRLSTRLAPIESDGPGDHDEWNLFTNYLPLEFGHTDELDERHSLSEMLDYWAMDCVRRLKPTFLSHESNTC